jgi:hypothetical protein
MWNGISIVPLHISYNSQHFKPIEYINGVVKFAPTLETNDPKVIINLDKFLSVPKAMVWQPPTQILDPNLHFNWNENFDSTLMNNLKNN